MRLSSRQKIGGGFILILFVLACVIPSIGNPALTQAPGAPVPELLETIIVQTAAIAQTRTAAALPPTLTPTLTREATSTLIAAPATQTPFSLFPGVKTETLDPAYAVTAGIQSLGIIDPRDEIPYTGLPWTCVVRATSPKGGIIQPETEFYAYWTVINTGTKAWTSTTVDFIYKSGYRHEGKIIQDLPSSVASGRSATFKVFYIAPKKHGMYTAVWTLKVGNRPFCGMKMFFEVPED